MVVRQRSSDGTSARRWTVVGLVTAMVPLVAFGPSSDAAAAPPTEVDLSTYVRVGRYPLPEPLLTPAPPGSVLAQEVSAVTYNPDTDTLFVVGDRGTSIVQVSKTGVLIDSMTLAAGPSPQGSEFYDPEGLTYVGAGQFVLVEERDRQAVRFTYVAGHHAATRRHPDRRPRQIRGQHRDRGDHVRPVDRRLRRREGGQPPGHLPDEHRLRRRDELERYADHRAGEPVRSEPARPVRLRRRVFAVESAEPHRPATGRQPPRAQPGSGQDRQRRPLGQRVEFVDDRDRSRRRARCAGTAARGAHDGPRRQPLRRQRERRRKHRSPRTLGLRPVHGAQRRADRRHARRTQAARSSRTRTPPVA